MPVNKPEDRSGSCGEFTFRAVGVIKSCAKYHYEAPRQSVYAASGAFLLWNDPIYQLAAEDLQGFDRIWLVWVFNLNKHESWHPKVRVPVPAERDKYSVFATRSPYRPNPIGISAVELMEIRPEGLLLGPCDLLDGTAVLDVKPYIPEVDAFPDSKAGWRDRIDQRKYHILWQASAREQADFIRERGALDLMNFARVQLTYRPLDDSRKRLDFIARQNIWVLHCRTWKLFFEISEADQQISILKIAGNYSAGELEPNAPDKYGDNALHREFISIFGPENPAV